MTTPKQWNDFTQDFETQMQKKLQELQIILNNSNATVDEKRKAQQDYAIQQKYLDLVKIKNAEIQQTGITPDTFTIDAQSASIAVYQWSDSKYYPVFLNHPIPEGEVSSEFIFATAQHFEIHLRYTRYPQEQSHYLMSSYQINMPPNQEQEESLYGIIPRSDQPSYWEWHFDWEAYDIKGNLTSTTWTKEFSPGGAVIQVYYLYIPELYAGHSVGVGDPGMYGPAPQTIGGQYAEGLLVGDTVSSPWEYLNNDLNPNIDPENRAFPDGYGEINSPFFLNLWSIKETKDDVKVANTFPYSGHDAGDGTFFSLIRAKIAYDSLERDADSNIVIKGLNFKFEDAVRKICQKENSNVPENFLLATYNFKDINSQYDFIPLGKMREGNTFNEEPSLVDLKNNSTIGACYKGQLISNYSISNPDYKISVVISWKGKPDSESWHGMATINIVNTLTDEVVETQIIDQPINNTYSFSLPSHTDDGEEIPYKISYKINDENNDWTIDPIQNDIIYYKDKKHSINIVNRWNKIIYDNTDTIIINVEKFDTDFKTKQVSEFFAYLKTKNAILDWEQEIKNNNNYKRMKENTAKIFCAQYKWSEHNGTNIEECFILIPFLSIAIKDIYGVVNIYTFHLRSPYIIDSDTPLKKDMYNGDLSIIWPYISRREYKYTDNSESKEWQLGAESTRLFGRKGCYEESDGQISLYYNWTNDKDIYYKEPPMGKTSNFYIGEPNIILPNEKYTTVNNSILYSKIELSEDNDKNILLSNFCIYCIDENCISDTNVEAAIPYYYKATISFPYGKYDDNLTNGAGVIAARVFFNDKNNYWNINAPDIASPADPPYKVHKWQDYGTNNYVDYQGDFIIVNTEKIQDAAVDVIGESFFNESKAILD